MSCVDFSARESRELTRIGKRRDWLLDFTKLWECDTSPCRLRWNQARAEKRCEDAPHSESISCEPLSGIRVHSRDSRAELGLQRSSSESPTTSSLPNDHFLMWNILLYRHLTP